MWWLKGTDDGDQLQEREGMDNNAFAEMKEQFEQQQQLIQQLKDLVRQNEEKLKKKDEELEGSASKLSKLNIQYKAKVAQLNKQLQENSKKNLTSSKSQNDDNSTTEASHVDSNRGKVLMLKKQLDDSRALFEKKIKEITENKNAVEQILETLRVELQERDDIIAQLKSADNLSASDSKSALALTNEVENQEAKDLNEMYAQMVYKDSKILELDSRILELERNVMDLQENLKEKDEVIQARNKAIQLMTEDLCRRGKAVVDQLDDTRDQMKFMQENFASAEFDWKEEKQRLIEQLTECESKILEKDSSIDELKASQSKLESIRFDLSTRNAELQEKVVRLQESSQLASEKVNVDFNIKLESLQKEIVQLTEEMQKRDRQIVELQKGAGDNTKSVNQKLIKLKAQHKSQVRNLEQQIKELQNSNINTEQIASLENRIVDLEEEKGNLQLKLVEFDELVSLQAHSEGVIRELKEKLQPQDTELDSYMKIVSAIEKQKLDLLEEIAQKNIATNTLREEKQLMESEISVLKIKTTDLEEKLLEYEKLNQEREKDSLVIAEIEDLKFEQQKQLLLTIEQDKLSLQSDVDELNSTIVLMKNLHEESKHELESIKLELNEKNEKLQLMEEQLKSELLHQEDVSSNFVSELDKVKGGFEREIEELKEEKGRLNLIIQEKDSLLNKFTDEISSLTLDNKNLIAVLSNKDEIESEKSVLIEKLSHELETLKESKDFEKSEMETKISSLTERLQMLEEQLKNELCHREDASNVYVSELNSVKCEFEREIEELKEEKDRLNLIIQEKNSSLDKLTDEVSNLTSNSNNLIVQLSNKDEIEREKNVLIEKLTHELETLKESSDFEKSEMESKISSLIDKLQIIEQQLKNELDSREEDGKNFVNELEKVKGDFENQIETLKTEKDHLNLVIQEKDNSLSQFADEISILEANYKTVIDKLASRDNIDKEKSALIDKLTGELEVLKESANAEKSKMETRISSLIDQLSDMDSEINRLQSLNSDSNIQLNTYLAEKNNVVEEMNNTRILLSEKDCEYRTLISEKESLQAKNDELHQIIKGKDTEIHQLIDSTDAKVKELVEAIEAKNVIERNMTNDMEELRTKVITAEGEVSKLEAQLSTLVKESGDKDALCLKNQSDIQSNLVVIKELEENLQTKCSKLDSLEDSIRLVNKDKEELQQQVALLSENVLNSQNMNLTLSTQLEETKEQLHNANQSKLTLQSELEEKQYHALQEKSEMEVLLNDHRTLLIEKQTELEHLQNKIKLLESESGNIDVWAKELEENLVKVKSENQVLISKNEGLDAIISEERKKFEKLNSNMIDLKNVNEQLNKENEVLTQSFNLLTTELNQIKDELENASEYLEIANSKVLEYELSLKSVKSELNDAQVDLDRLRLESQTLTKEKSDLEGQLNISRNRVEELSREVDEMKANNSTLEMDFKELKERQVQQTLDHEATVSKLEDIVKMLQSQLQEDEMKFRETIDMIRLEEIKRQNELSDSKSTLEANFEGVVSQLSVLETERNNILQEKLFLVNKTEELQQFYDRCQIQEVELQNYRDKVEVLQSEITLITEEKNRLREQNDRLMDYNQQLETDLASTFEASKLLENEKESLSSTLSEKCKELESELNKERAVKQDSELCITDLKTKFTSLQDEYLKLQQEFDNREKELLIAADNFRSLSDEFIAIQDKNAEMSKESQRFRQLLDEKSQETEKLSGELKSVLDEKQQLINQQQSWMEKSSNMERDIEINNSLNQNLESALAEISKERQLLDKRNAELKHEIDSLKNILLNKDVEIEEMNKHNTEVNLKFQESENQKHDACQQLQQTKTDLLTLQTSSKELIDAANRELETIQTEMSSKAEQLQYLTDLNATLEGQLEEKGRNIQNLEALVTELRQHLNLKDNRVIELENATLSLNDKMHALESNMNEVGHESESAKVELQKQIEILLADTAEKKQSLERLHVTTEQQELDISVKGNRINELENTILTLSQNISDLELHLSNLEQKNGELVNLNQNLAQHADQLIKDVQEKEVLVQQYHTTIQDLQQSISLHSTHEDELQKSTLDLTEKISNLEANLTDLNQRNYDIATTNSNLNQKIEQLVEEVQNKTKDVEEKELLVKRFEEMINDMQRDVSLKQSRISELENSTHLLTEKIEELENSKRDVVTANLELNGRVDLLLSETDKAKMIDDLKESHVENNHQISDQVTPPNFDEQNSQFEPHSSEARSAEFQIPLDDSNQIVSDNELVADNLNNDFENIVNQSTADVTDSKTVNSDRDMSVNNIDISFAEAQPEKNSELRIAELNQEIRRLNEKCVDFVRMQEKLEEVEKLNHILNEEKLSWENTNSKYSDNRENNSEKLEEELALQAIEKLKVEISGLQAEKNSYETELYELKTIIAKLNTEKSELQTLLKKESSPEKGREETESRTSLTMENDPRLVFREPPEKDLPRANEQLLGTPSAKIETPGEPQVSPGTSPDHKQLKNKLAVLQIKNEKMLSKLKLFKDKNDKLQLQINDLITTRAALEDDRVRMTEYNERAKNEIHHLSGELRNLERMWKTEVKMLHDRLDTVEIANSKLVEIKEHLERALVTANERNELLRQEKSNLELNVTKMKEERELLNNKHQEVISQISQESQQWQRQVDSLKKHNEFLESDNSEFQNLISRLQAEKAKSDQGLKAQSEKCTALMDELQKLKEGLRDLRPEDIGNVADLQKSYTTLQKDYKELINIRVQLEAEIEDLRTELDVAVKDRAQLEKEREELRESLQGIHLNSGSDDGIVAFESQNFGKEFNNDDRAKSIELHAEVESLKKELEGAKSDNVQLNETLQELRTRELDQTCADRLQMQGIIDDLKVQNSDLMTKKSALEVEVWKLEEDMQQIADDAKLNEQKAVTRVLAELEKLQLENRKFQEELEAQDTELRIVEKEKEQIEAESRLTFQQQQETIKHLQAQMHNFQEEISSVEEMKTKYEDSILNLRGELAEVQEQFKEVLSNLNTEKSRAFHFETVSSSLQAEVESLGNKLLDSDNDKAELLNEILKLRNENNSYELHMENFKKHLRSTHRVVDIDAEVTEESFQRSARDPNNTEMNLQVAKLEGELQQVMVSLHSKDVRCEELTSEISDLIHERDSLQLRLSALLRVDHQKEVKIKLLEESLANQTTASEDINEFAKVGSNLASMDGKQLSPRLHSMEEKCKELYQINSMLEQTLSAERENRYKIAADLKFANEELAALQKRPNAAQETVLSVNEDVPLLPERSQTLVRSYTGTTWRILNWIQGRSVPRAFVMHV